MNQRRDKVQRFTDLEVWRKSHELFLHILVDLESLPNNRVAGTLTDQVIRALGSVGANIAEGFNRSNAKYLNFLEIALGEANETENWITNSETPNCSCTKERTSMSLKRSKSRKCLPHFTVPLPLSPADSSHPTPDT